MNSIEKLLPVLKKDFPVVAFSAGDSFVWSPTKQLITYTTSQPNNDHGVWALIHEVAHYQLGHNSYGTDFNLLQLETSAWSQAEKTAKNYNITIDPDHIQDCLDTYRDWLHKRAKCPTCSVVSMQRKDKKYQCFNCNTAWSVPKSPLCKIKKEIVTK